VGRCAFYWGTSKQSKKLAELYVDEGKKAGYSTHGNGLHAGERGSWTNLHINRETNMPAVLTENGFMDNASDFKLIFGSKQEEYTDKMARVHVKAIQRFLKKDFKDGDVKPETPKKETPAKKPAKTSKWNDVGNKWTGQVLRLNDRGGAVKDLQKLVGVTADGMFGKDTQNAVKKAQKKSGVAVDGTRGPNTYKALTKKSKGANLSVDGKWGKSTTRALQKALGAPVDGIISGQPNNAATKALYGGISHGSNGSPMVRALQKKIGSNTDGKLGPETVRKLQK